VRVRVLVVSALCATLAIAVPATSAESTAAKPATAAQVTKLVAAAANIKQLSTKVAEELSGATNDFSWTNYPNLESSGASDCVNATDCVYGDTTSKEVVVLYGDSHAVMWLPALVPVAVADKFKLILIWQGACSVADLNIYAPVFGYPAICNADRVDYVKDIQVLDPNVVIVAERTADVASSATKLFTAAQWKAGLETTINQIKSTKTKVIVLEDTPLFNASVPTCLARYSSKIRQCAVAYPNPRAPGLESAEQAAAKATHSLYVKTQGWFCTKTCSAVIGSYIPFIDDNHVSFAYASYLSGVMGVAIKTDL
jgi:hypothetical protein